MGGDFKPDTTLDDPRDEYILNEHQFQFTNDTIDPDTKTKTSSGTPYPGSLWNIGQFSESSLLAAMLLIDIPMGKEWNNGRPLDKTDPIMVARVLSYLGNAYVMYGNWESDVPMPSAPCFTDSQTTSGEAHASSDCNPPYRDDDGGVWDQCMGNSGIVAGGGETGEYNPKGKHSGEWNENNDEKIKRKWKDIKNMHPCGGDGVPFIQGNGDPPCYVKDKDVSNICVDLTGMNDNQTKLKLVKLEEGRITPGYSYAALQKACVNSRNNTAGPECQGIVNGYWEKEFDIDKNKTHAGCYPAWKLNPRGASVDTDWNSMKYCTKPARPGGTQMGDWAGSVQILSKFLQNMKDNLDNPKVKWAQCWIFAGVLNTLMRTLGIPCLQLTNFSSNHSQCPAEASWDTGHQCGTQAQVSYPNLITMGNDGQPVGSYDGMIWNFHSWNQVWMRRPDINTDANFINSLTHDTNGFDGWQALDATPQEFSENTSDIGGPKGWQFMGPAPMKAVLHLGGSKYYDPETRDQYLKETRKSKYDTSFVISEANFSEKYPRSFIVDVNQKGWVIQQADNRVYTSKPGALSTAEKWRDQSQEITNQYRNVPDDKQSALNMMFSESPSLNNAHRLLRSGVLQPKVRVLTSINGLDSKIKLSIFFSTLQKNVGTVNYRIIMYNVMYTGKIIGQSRLPISGSEELNESITKVELELDEEDFDLSQSNYVLFMIRATFGSEGDFGNGSTTLLFPSAPISLKISGKKAIVLVKNPYKNTPLTQSKVILHVTELGIDVSKNIGVIRNGETASVTIPLVAHDVHHTVTKALVQVKFNCTEIYKASSESALINWY